MLYQACIHFCSCAEHRIRYFEEWGNQTVAMSPLILIVKKHLIIIIIIYIYDYDIYARKQFAEDKQTKDMDYWNHVLWSDETKINLFGSDGVKRVWRQPGEEYKDKCVLPTVKHGGGSVMVWGCMSIASTGELQFIEGTMNANMYCDILKQRLGRRAVFQHDNDPKHTSKMTTALLKKLRVKVMDWPSMSPDLNPIEHLWGILKWKVEERKVSNIHQLQDVVMEEWKRTPCGNLWSSGELHAQEG